jgi:hypothetical protein
MNELLKLDTKTGMYECDDLTALGEQVFGVKPVTGLTMGAFADKIIANAQAAEQRRVEDALIDEQHEAIDAMQPEMIRQHETRGIVAVGTNGAYKVWYSIGPRGQTFGTASYSEAVRLMERALADGAGVVTIERAYGFVWTQEVWALVGKVR